MTENNYVKVGTVFIDNGNYTIANKIIKALREEGFTIAHGGFKNNYNSEIGILIDQKKFDWEEESNKYDTE